MDDEENKPAQTDNGVTQIPLIHDLVFDPSRPLKPPRKPTSTSRKRSQFPPGYDPDTADLFDDLPFEDLSFEDLSLHDNIEPASFADEAGAEFTDVDFTDDSDKKLKAELTEELSSILEDLKGDSKA